LADHREPTQMFLMLLGPGREVVASTETRPKFLH
jgi:hypothetical protein